MAVIAEHTAPATNHPDELSPEDARAILDYYASSLLGMSGAAFVEAWDRGDYAGDPERPEVTRVAMLLPLVR